MLLATAMTMAGAMRPCGNHDRPEVDRNGDRGGFQRGRTNPRMGRRVAAVVGMLAGGSVGAGAIGFAALLGRQNS